MDDFFGERIQEERKRLKLSQTEFASAGGVVLNTQFTYEKNKRIPDAKYLAAIAKAGADVTYILTGVRSEERRPEVVAEEVAGVLYVIESILKKERVEIPPDQKARMVLEAYKKSTPEERQMMIKALEEGVFMLPLSIAKLFRFVS
ncbi:MAG: XRE family transcriptional regulator [Magnetococcales bacterium]|nr:XRE family transcriptional regulator [Magnetococcales bacterium]